MNAINSTLPSRLSEAVRRANEDPNIHVIVLSGAGAAFCAGYDLHEFAERDGALTDREAKPQDEASIFAEYVHKKINSMPWDPLVDYQIMGGFTEHFMSLWRSLKPVICKVHGYAIAGGSDIALCCDLILMEENARIGYPPARVWGCPTTAMWVYRVGMEKAKRLLLTGDTITGREAEKMGLITAAHPASQLDAEVEKLAKRIATVPKNQLAMQKLVINQAYESMGLASTQRLAVIMDGIARHTPEGLVFQNRAREVGWKQAVKERDRGDPIYSKL